MLAAQSEKIGFTPAFAGHLAQFLIRLPDVCSLYGTWAMRRFWYGY